MKDKKGRFLSEVKIGDINFKNQFYKSIDSIIYLKIDIGTKDAENQKLSLLIPNNIKIYDKIIKLMKMFVDENF